MEVKYRVIIWVIAIIILVGLVSYSIARPKSDLNSVEKEALAKCLTEKKIYLYGAFNCPNCAVQKEMFDSAVEFITYINCDLEPDKCDINENAYPYWKIGEMTVKGPVPLKFLKEKSSC